jgi:hypothetical protein
MNLYSILSVSSIFTPMERNPTMDTRYFVKFIGDKHVTLAVARSNSEAETLIRNQFEETTPEFYRWVQAQTKQIH